jgi:putative transposase
VLIRQARKYRVYPTKEQQHLLAIQFGHARYVYNQALANRKAYYKLTGKGLSTHDTITNLVVEKGNTEWLKEADSQVLQQKLRDLDTAYKNFFQKRAKYPKFKSKRGKNTIRYPQRVKFSDSCTYLPKVGWVKTVFHRPLIGTQKSVTVSRTKTGKYFVSVLCEYELEIPENTNPSVGIDLGLTHFAILSNGEKVASPRHLREAEKRLAKAQKRLSRKKKGSANRAKARIKVARLHEQIANQRKDFLHKLSHNITSRFGFVALEDLHVAGMVKNHCLAKSISDSGWGAFVTMCGYKANLSGGYLYQIGRFFPSSKTCSNCGYINSNLQLSDRDWLCPECSTTLDRDINAAVNILAQATAGVAGSNACGDCVRPAKLSA